MRCIGVSLVFLSLNFVFSTPVPNNSSARTLANGHHSIPEEKKINTNVDIYAHESNFENEEPDTKSIDTEHDLNNGKQNTGSHGFVTTVHRTQDTHYVTIDQTGHLNPTADTHATIIDHGEVDSGIHGNTNTSKDESGHVSDGSVHGNNSINHGGSSSGGGHGSDGGLDHGSTHENKDGHDIPPPSHQLQLHLYSYKPDGFEIFKEETGSKTYRVWFYYDKIDHYDKYIMRIR